ncbi:MAG: branched-chain amino acid ABC transporter permease [Dehalococcoidia bacterium]|jgi:branched-chain amino acid transport system permease protein
MLSVLIFGIINSMQFAILAVGFSLILSIAGVANFAYGSLYLFGGFIVWLLSYKLGFPYWGSVGISAVVIFMVSILIYRYGIRRVRGATLSEVIVTMGIGLFITEMIRASGLLGVDDYIQPFVHGYINIMGNGMEIQRLLIVPIGIVLFLALWIVTKFTKMGLAFRAISQDELTALSIGLSSDRLGMMAMGISSILALFAALCILPQGQFLPDSAYDILVYALAISVLGGLGSTPGIIVGALILGFTQTLTATYINQQWTIVATFLIIVLVLLVRPSGIFGQQKQLEERV